MKDDAMILGRYCTARKTYGQILLFVPGEQTDSGDYIQPQEIYLRKEEIEKLYAWVMEEENG